MSHAGGRRKKGGHHEEEHENHERWLLTYADMITLLMVLFIVMFAISQVDKQKFAALASGISIGFGRPVQVLDGGKGPLKEEGNNPQPLQLGVVGVDIGTTLPEKLRKEAAKIATQEAQRREQIRRAEAEGELESLEETKTRIKKALAAKGLSRSVAFRYDERGLVVSVVTDRVLFAANRATLATDGRRVLDAVSPVLRTLPNNIIVEGHTNQAKVKPTFYPSEWELSSARAASVVRYLITTGGLVPKHMSAVGYADQHPLYSGAKGLRLNRRVEIVIGSRLSPQSRGLLPEVVAEKAAAKKAAADKAAATKESAATEKPAGGSHDQTH